MNFAPPYSQPFALPHDVQFPNFGREVEANAPSPAPQLDTASPVTDLMQLPPQRGHARTTVLLLHHDEEIRGLLRFGLERQGFRVLEVGSLSRALEVAIRLLPGAVLLDLDAVEDDGVAAIRRFREWTQIPLLVLAGRADSIGAVSALDHGATDYITRPFRLEELAARVRAAQRNGSSGTEVFRSGSLSVDLENRVVKVGERAVRLSSTEFSLLACFVRHAGKALTHTQLLHEVWGAEMEDKVSYLRVYLLSLRKKLENPPEPDLFLTERSVGYRLVIREPWSPAPATG